MAKNKLALTFVIISLCFLVFKDGHDCEKCPSCFVYKNNEDKVHLTNYLDYFSILYKQPS